MCVVSPCLRIVIFIVEGASGIHMYFLPKYFLLKMLCECLWCLALRFVQGSGGLTWHSSDGT